MEGNERKRTSADAVRRSGNTGNVRNAGSAGSVRTVGNTGNTVNRVRTGSAGTTVRMESTGRTGTTVRGESTGRTGTTVRGESTGRAGTTVRGESTGRTGTTVRGESTGRAGTTVHGESTGRRRSTGNPENEEGTGRAERTRNGESTKNAKKSGSVGNRRKSASKTTRRRSKKKSSGRQTGFNQLYLVGGGAILLIIVIFFGVRSCGVSHGSPEGVVKELIRAYGDGKASRAKNCYMPSEENEEILQKEINATIEYFKAHKPRKVSVERCGVLSKSKNYTYVYIIYNMELENGQTYPSISTYMTGTKEKKYYVYPPSDVTEEMSQQAAVDYAKFMTTDIYKNYVTAYETFIKKNPGYEERIAGKLQ